MKTISQKLYTIIITLSLSVLAGCLSAQYVIIPDTNFANYLNTVVPSAMNGTQMDTTNLAVTSLKHMSIENSGIKDLTGIKYFSSLVGLYCGNHYSLTDSNKITTLSSLPSSLDTLICSNGHLDSLGVLPKSLVYLICSNNFLAVLPSLPSGLTYLDCSGNSSLDTLPKLDSVLISLNCLNDGLTTLPALPRLLTNLTCDFNRLDSLPVLDSALTNLRCAQNALTGLPSLPSSLTYLYCYDNQINSLPTLDSSLIDLICGNNLLATLPTLPNSLQVLKCYSNQITVLPALPNSINYIDCSSNKLPSLPTLPNSLTTLICSSNLLPNLPALNSLLSYLDCSSNQLVALPGLSISLTYLNCSTNRLILLPILPGSLGYLDCSQNQIMVLPSLPSSLSSLTCAGNLLPALPALPGSLQFLNCSANQLKAGLPVLPPSLCTLSCYSDSLTSLPTLPPNLRYLYCGFNQLSSLPVLPNLLNALSCENNRIACFPVFPASLLDSALFNITGNPFHCLPNYVHAMNISTLGYYLCGIGNVNGCPTAHGVVGFTYRDMNSNCVKDSGDLNIVNVPMNMYNTGSVWMGQTYTAVNGVYDFPDSAGIYKVVVDTTGMPFEVQCAHPGADSVVIIATIDTNVNFSLTCKSGFDVGVQSIIPIGLVFPGTQHNLSVVAGDLSQWYRLNCAKGDSGTVRVRISGPVSYAGPAAGALVPVVSGNLFTYKIPDFGAVNNKTAFNILLNTDTTANAGDSICVTVSVTPLDDNNPDNNTYHYCYPVVNSHDPNAKTVYPVNVVPHYNGWFVYTIYFQNIGSAMAKNILVVDTLDKNLDASTFMLINYSNPNMTQLNGSILNVNFPNINLPDSSSNPKGSIGYIQYKIKPKKSKPIQTTIYNTGYIYFDFNPAVVTNTTVNQFINVTSVSNIQQTVIETKVFPNPNNGAFMISLQDIQPKCSIVVYNELGESIYSTVLASGNTQINLTDKPQGVYFFRIIADDGTSVSSGRFIIQK